jgi:hypothetical protein
VTPEPWKYQGFCGLIDPMFNKGKEQPETLALPNHGAIRKTVGLSYKAEPQ